MCVSFGRLSLYNIEKEDKNRKEHKHQEKKEKRRTENEMKQNKGILSMDANALCTLTFALASILSAHKNKCCQNLFIYGVLGCILFVMPTINAPPETLESIIIQTIQKVCLTYSTSLLIAGAFILHDPINVNNQKQ